MFPILKRSAKIKKQEKNQVVLEYLDQEILLEGVGAELFKKTAEYFNGSTSISAIAEKTAESASKIKELTDQLQATGVLGIVPADLKEDSFKMTGLEFYELHRKYATFWLRPVYEHPLWKKIITGKANRAQVIGFAFEKYHYIEGAHEHMAVAAANATPEMMPHLARHFIEEYTHGDIYRHGLKSLFPNDLVLNSQPLPSTRALVNFLSETAARNSFSYYAGNEVLQMTENISEKATSESINDFYLALRKHYPYTDKLVDSFIAHTRVDEKLGHEDVFLAMCKSIPTLTRNEVKDAMNVVYSTTEHLLLFMDGIDTWYSVNETLPRVPCTLLSE